MAFFFPQGKRNNWYLICSIIVIAVIFFFVNRLVERYSLTYFIKRSDPDQDLRSDHSILPVGINTVQIHANIIPLSPQKLRTNGKQCSC